jgi:glycosyltransferase involved in cell wall biosynthesis
MAILINFYNQIGAGPKNISLNFIDQLIKKSGGVNEAFILIPNFSEYENLKSAKHNNVHLIKLPKFNSLIFKAFFRIYLEFLLVPCLVKRHKVASYLAFGNFLMTPLKIKKTVLLHHPYLFDDDLFYGLNFRSKVVEGLKRLVLAITLKNVDVVVVQSSYVKSAFQKCWSQFDRQVEVISNPISGNFPKDLGLSLDALVNPRLQSAELKILYVSRFYPHKNHHFLLALSKALNQIGIQHVIQVTLDKKIAGVKEFMQQTKDSGANVTNVGEVSQQDLSAYYQAATIFLFPSKSETFGNPMIEAMKYGLPIVVPDLPYTKAIVGDGGNFYKEDNAEQCVEAIKNLADNTEYYRYSSKHSYDQFQKFPSVREWVSSYIKLIS